jgi:hypothetical protein
MILMVMQGRRKVVRCMLVAATFLAASLYASESRAGNEAEGHRATAVFRYPSPPAGFKPLTATDEELARYGLPPRPNPFARSTIPYATWAHVMAAAHTHLDPVIQLTGRRHGPAQTVHRAGVRRAGALGSTNWAGQALYNPVSGFGPGSYTEILGQWVVSAVQQAIGTCDNGTDVSATWIGIDGTNGSSDVLQAGTESDASCSFGTTSGNYYAWFEWYPGDEFQVTNFAVYPGAPVFVVVTATSAVTGSATLVNLQSNQYTTVGISAPSGTQLTGDSAEWIVERPALGNNNKLGNLADYGMIWMSSEIAYIARDVGTDTYDVPGDPGAGRVANSFTMYDENDNPLAGSFPQGPSAQDLNVQGSAY